VIHCVTERQALEVRGLPKSWAAFSQVRGL
jgi:hypothetical protein